MVPEKSLVIYKNRPAIVTGFEGDKINIAVIKGETFKVREKDIELLHPGPCALKDLEERLSGDGKQQGAAPEAAREAALLAAREAWELLEGNPSVSFKELTELCFGAFSPKSALAAWELLREGLFFTGDIHSIKARPRDELEGELKRREEKQRETGDRAAFLEKLKKLSHFQNSVSFGNGFRKTGFEAGFSSKSRVDFPKTEVLENHQLSNSKITAAGDDRAGSAAGALSQEERRFLLDVEALARKQTDKSRTLRELGRPETPEEAHRLLLTSGAWTVWENPHPARFGLDRKSAAVLPPPPPSDEDRLDLTGLAAFAIDSPWSDDPDDAVSLEGPDAAGNYCLWVHVADPAASILPGSPADIEARNRGATLYLPEGPSRMLSDGALPLFALGLSDVSPALSFKITLKPDLTVGGTDIIPSFVKVSRLTYADADALISGEKPSQPGEALSRLAALMERNVERRLDTGAVMIDLPEAHITVKLDAGLEFSASENYVSVERIDPFRSADMVRECMILAGEGAALWALQKQLPIPFISQEAGELPAKRLSGLAGAWRLRRCMRSRVVSAKPAVHWGLGLDQYTQVTSPLRRYIDLLCHQQIRAKIGSGNYRSLKPLSEEEIVLRSSAADAASSTVSQAERASRSHWMGVYLLKNSHLVHDGVVLDRKGNSGTVMIPGLGLETQAGLKGNEEPNENIRLRLSRVKIPEGEANFVLEG